MSKWRERGYKVAMWRDMTCTARPPDLGADFVRHEAYPGVAVAHNELIKAVFAMDKSCDWVVAGADDTDPDAGHTADQIADQCFRHFDSIHSPAWHPTFGVMQPTGDRWGEQELYQGKTGSAYIDRICGSPWIGREFARRVNQGCGPFWPEYRHMYADQELQETATKLGVLWQRRDLIHYHDHVRRDGFPRTPEFLTEAYSQAHWDKYTKLFYERQAAGFPGSECIA